MKIRTAIILLFATVTFLFAETELEKNLRTCDQMINVGDSEKAENLLRSLQKSYPTNEGVLWRLGQALNRKADKMTGKERHDVYEEANTFLIQSIKLNCKIPQAHVEMARSLGYTGLFKDEWDSYSLAGRVKEELDIAARQDSCYADIYYISGLWNRYVSQRPLLIRMPQGLGGASEDEAIRSFQKAIKLNPDNAMYYLELGRQYILMNNYAEAKTTLKKATSTKNNLFNKRYIEEAQRLLDSLKEKE